MRLIKLRANRETFRTVEFNRNGLTLIVGKKSDPDDRDRGHSTNGVGKSLLLYLVNFCLGSSENEALKEQLPGWEFSLDYELEGVDYTATRSTDNQGSIRLNDEQTPLEDYTDLLGKSVFQLPEAPIKYLTFRSLIGLFLRQGKAAYIKYSQAWYGERVYSQQLRTAYLLGLDEQLVDKKRELKEEKERISSIRKQFKKDSLLRDYFHGDRDAGLELKDLNEEIEKLENEVKEFRVAENYDDISEKAETTRRKWRRARNELNSLQSSIRQIESSLEQQPDVSAEQVQSVYEAAKVELPSNVTKRLDDVAKFHEELVASRARRLTVEKHRIERRVTELEEEIAKLDTQKDEYYHFLGTHGALQEYETLLNTLADRKKSAGRLEEFKKLKKDCDDRWDRNKRDMREEDVRANEYLESSEDITESVNDLFRTMARRIWVELTCGLLVENDNGDNKQRFKIDAKIQGDTSDGRGESKIFCFDMTVLLGARNHAMRFLMHDNRLYPGIDPRQRAEVFRIADEMAQHHDCQYVATINQENLDSMKKIMEPDDFRKLFEANTKLNLLDDSDAGKLLGVTVELEYEKE